jgi:hypothetical protein
MMAEPQTRGHELTTADLAGQLDAQRQPYGPKLVKGQQLETPPLFSESEMGEFRSRWSNVQTGFVDEPRRTVEDADKLVASVMQRLAEGVRERAVGVGKAVGPGRRRLHRRLAGCPAALSFVL